MLPHLCAQLIKKLKQHQVLIVTAPTGSGKSTQLPQYVLDHVLDPNETRQVAVLQPRRVNASSLCDRVAEERGTLAGREVGYTVGRGEEKASSERLGSRGWRAPQGASSRRCGPPAAEAAFHIPDALCHEIEADFVAMRQRDPTADQARLHLVLNLARS